MYSKELEEIIEAALADGEMTDKKRAVIHKRALAEGVDLDELDIIIDGRLAKLKKSDNLSHPVSQKKATTEKYGSVLKCPSCGAQVVGGSAVCAECGCTFSDVEANSSFKRLYAKLEEIEVAYRSKMSFSIPVYGVSSQVKEKVNVIRMFPVPNTRADLLEFLGWLSAQMDSMKKITSIQVLESATLKKAYEAKFDECVNKARLNFADDNDFAPYFERKKSIWSKFFRK